MTFDSFSLDELQVLFSKKQGKKVSAKLSLMGQETCYFCMNKPCPAAILRWGKKTRRAKVVLFIFVVKTVLSSAQKYS